MKTNGWSLNAVKKIEDLMISNNRIKNRIFINFEMFWNEKFHSASHFGINDSKIIIKTT